MNWQEARRQVLSAADQVSGEIRDLAMYIYSNPEVGYEEVKSSARVAQVMAEHGFSVERGVAGLPTAVRAEWRGAEEPAIGFLAEYDCLPGLGHACGHNLIAAMSVGAALACKAAGLPARIVLFGTPAEEAGGGKVSMTAAGLFDGLDAAMMVHPSNYSTCGRTSLAMRPFKLKFHGKPAHASGRAEDGINALEAAVQTYVAINGLRQHLPTDVRIHGIFSHGGSAPNIVPEYAELYYYVRAATMTVMEEAYRRAVDCARGAALATGTSVDVEQMLTYRERVESPELGAAYISNLHELGVSTIDPRSIKGVGSSDAGNVSHVAPMIHAYLQLASGDVKGHTRAFAEAAGTPHALDVALLGVKALALTAVDLVFAPGMLEEVRREFAARKGSAAR